MMINVFIAINPVGCIIFGHCMNSVLNYTFSILKMSFNMAILSVLLFCNFNSVAQQPSTGYSRNPLSPLDKKLNHRLSFTHTNIQPAAHNMDSSFFMQSDSSYTIRRYKNMLHISPIGDVAGGYQFQDNQQALGRIAAGVDVQYNFSNKLHLQLG